MTYTPTLNDHFADVLAITVNDEGHAGTSPAVAQTTTQEVGIVNVTPADTVAENGTYTVTRRLVRIRNRFVRRQDGTFVLDNPATFTGHIADISSSTDVIELDGFAATTTARPPAAAALTSPQTPRSLR